MSDDRQPDAEPALSSDAPLVDPKLDRLGHAPFAKVVATSIAGITDPEGFVYAINGPWGSGKTTVVNFVLHELAPDIDAEAIYVVRFNPWWFTGQEDLTRAFFSELISVVGKPLGEQAETALRKFVKSVSGAETTLRLAFSVIPGLNKLPADIRDAALEQFGIAGDAVDTDKSLFELKGELAEQLRKTSFRTLVIIDDIDRLTSEEQLQIFKLVKSVADLPNIVYLLVFDDRLAEAALSNRPEFQGGAYLEKIVQAPFDLPMPPSESLGDWFVELLNEIIDEHDISDRGRWLAVWQDIVSPVLTTPRAVTKLVNALRVAWPVVGDNVDLADFVAIEATRLFNKPVFDLIQRHRDWLVGRVSISLDQRSETADKLLATLRENDRERARKTLGLLFPRFASAKSGVGTDQDAATHLASRRVCHLDFFDVYFQFAVKSEIFSAADWEGLMKAVALDEHDAERAVVAYFTAVSKVQRRRWGTKALPMLQFVSAVARDLEPATAERLLVYLIGCGDVLLIDANLRAPLLVGGIDWLLSNTCLDLLERIPESRRGDVLARGFAKENGFVTAGLALTCVGQTVGRHLSLGNLGASRSRMIADETFDSLETRWLERLEVHAADYSLLDLPLTYRTVIGRWNEIAGPAPVKDWLESAWSDESRRVALLRLVMLYGESSAHGRYPIVHRKHLQQFIDVDLLAESATVTMKTEDPGSDAYAIAKEFLEGLERGAEEGTTET